MDQTASGQTTDQRGGSHVGCNGGLADDQVGCIISEGGDCCGPKLCNRIEALEEAGEALARMLKIADATNSNVQWWGDTSLAGRRKKTHREEAQAALAG